MNKGIFKTIVYYDCLGYPLTKEELAVFSFKDKGSEGANLVEKAGSFYFLPGRQNLVEERAERNKTAEEKWRKALKAVWWLQLIPYIRLVFASGSLALSNTDKESDLDFLVVVRHGRIWTARSSAVFLLNFLGLLRRRGQTTAPDKVCLNHLITDKSLYIPRKSIYTAQLYARLVPILVEDERLLNDFCEVNRWVGEWVDGWPVCLLANSPDYKIGDPRQSWDKERIANRGVLKSIRKIGEKILDTKFGDWVEAILRKYNLHRIKNYHLTHKPGGRVKADDESLEFHPDSPELKIIERYNKTMIKLGFPGLAKETDSGLTRETSFVK